MIDWEKTDEGFECPHCADEGYAALLWICCAGARAEFVRLAKVHHPPAIVLSAKWQGLVNDVNWLSLEVS